MNKALSNYSPLEGPLTATKETIEELNLYGENHRKRWTEYLEDLEEEIYATE